MALGTLKHAIKRTWEFFGIALRTNQYYGINYTSSPSKTILIIGHGEVSIPPMGWGAVETVIHETGHTLGKRKYRVWVLNSKSIWKWLSVKMTQSPHVIILHDDTRISRVKMLWPQTPVILVTHYAYAAFPEKWNPVYRKNVLRNFRRVNTVVCLSPRILQTFKNFISESKLLLVPNGTNLETVQNPSTIRKGLLCVGKVEERKRQFELFQQLRNSEVKVDFIGPIIDSRVLELMTTNDEIRNHFHSEVSRDELPQKMAQYRGLILTSEAEADALVLYEAQRAGLEILVSENSVGAQDPTLRWIHVLPVHFQAADIENLYQGLQANPQDIVRFAEFNYSWDRQLEPLMQLIDKL